MSKVPPHSHQTPTDKDINSQFADVILRLILHAHGGELTITKDQMQAYLKVKMKQALIRQVNPDGSITFRMQPCPQHDDHEHLIHDDMTR